MEVFFKFDFDMMLIIKNDFEIPRDGEGKELEKSKLDEETKDSMHFIWARGSLYKLGDTLYKLRAVCMN